MKKMVLFLMVCFSIPSYTTSSFIPLPVSKASESIVKIVIKGTSDSPKKRLSSATGFRISSTDIVTNRHVAKELENLDSEKNEILIQTQDNKPINFQRVRLKSKSYDLAVLEVENFTGPILEFDPLPSVAQYDSIGDIIIPFDISFLDEFYLSGFPGGQFQNIKSRKMEKSGFESDYTIFTDFNGRPNGISGGPLLNDQGKAVGVLARASGSSTFYAIPIRHLIELLKQPSLSPEKSLQCNSSFL